MHKVGFVHKAENSLLERYKTSFPFTLTGAQERAIADIVSDMSQNRPMLRMLQGDVGSGKTVVAFFGCIVAWKNNRQAAIMAPTEILAQQHFLNFQKLLGKGIFKDLKVALLISSIPAKEKKAIYQSLKEGEH